MATNRVDYHRLGTAAQRVLISYVPRDTARLVCRVWNVVRNQHTTKVSFRGGSPNRTTTCPDMWWEWDIDTDADFQLSHEVANAFWRPLNHLTNPARQFTHTFSSRGFPRNLPAIDLLGPGKPPLWGITYRFVAQITRIVGHPLPES